MKTKTPLPPPVSTTDIDLSSALLVNGKTLEPQPVKHSTPTEQKFKAEKEFTDLIIDNSKILFGERTILMDATRSPLTCYLLFDFSADFKFYFLDISHSKQNFWELFERITRLFTFLNQPDYPSMMMEILEALIGENKALKKELSAVAGGIEIDEELFANKPFILLLTDQERPEYIQMTTTYSTSWGKFVKLILLKKYEDYGTLFCLMSPAFTDLDFKLYSKNEKTSRKQEKTTEDDHLVNASDAIRDGYRNIKNDLLIEDASIEFNPKQYYVSMRKGKNLAFFHIRKNLISLVVLCSEEETKKYIKHHAVKTLTEKVQKFWNGASCTVVIENGDNLNEVSALLKMIVKQQG
jgi:predicted transport protein